MRLFGIRIAIWEGDSISIADESLWTNTQTKYPNWGLFKRLQLSSEDRAKHEQAFREAESFFEMADEIADSK
jgi:hypothetical protein